MVSKLKLFFKYNASAEYKLEEQVYDEAKGERVTIKRRLTGKFECVKWRNLRVTDTDKKKSNKKKSNNDGHDDAFISDDEDSKKKVVHGLVYRASPLDPS